VTVVVEAPRDAVAAGPADRPARPRRGTPLLGGGWGRTGGLVVALVVLAVVAACSIAFGAKAIPFGTVWQALVDRNGSTDHQIVRDLRIPRTLLGLGVGGALGVAGALMQGVTRNPLADPGLREWTPGPPWPWSWASTRSASPR
jgi:iron complex transport system permease protein